MASSAALETLSPGNGSLAQVLDSLRGLQVVLDTTRGSVEGRLVMVEVIEEEPETVSRPERRRVPDGSETVLLVEDEAPVRKLLQRALQQQGYAVLAARDGLEAIELAADRPIDILVTDVVMPRMGGFALARRLRGDQPGLPVLFVSAHPQKRTAGRAREVIMGSFIQKPRELRSLTGQ